ncbi:hypothetical protein F5Y05DRAFT_174436 [Hypoxylon sp. FL0543]|nr:hypothetical protein F5Y05DRAFT_174436 [Hypoxylon sp. FL0543]
MPSQARLEIYNPTYEKGHGYFPLFSLLPKELRLEVWRHSLQRHRIIVVKLRMKPQPRGNRGFLLDALPMVRGHQILSKLLRVNSESRETAQRFYRVRLPCDFQRGGTVKPGTLLFNPEFDIVHVRPGTYMNKFVNLICDLKTSDPRGVGILRLALDMNDLTYIHGYLSFRRVNPQKRKVFMAAISQLDEVFFMKTGEIRPNVFGRREVDVNERATFLRALPVASEVSSFDLIARDPRPIADGLDLVFVGRSDGLKMVFVWHKLLRRWARRGLEQPPRAKYHFLLSSGTYKKQKVVDRATAEDWLREEDMYWARFLGYRAISKSDYELEQAPPPKNAIGFWLFPVEALGPLPSDKEVRDAGPGIWKRKLMMDFSAHWPALGLSHLP